jgi:phthalate 4,5-dioxygenase oxygenase subunit
MPLSPEKNIELTGIGPGSPMGALFREYWHPIARSASLIAGGAPVRIPLLGDRFVAFRGEDGRLGVLAEACPHRGTSLALAHNEGNALRCIFHGWKIDTSGKVIDMPNEPAHRACALAAAVRVHHFPVRESGGLVWMFPNESKAPPPFPEFEFSRLPSDHIDIRILKLKTNWLQMMEAAIDSSHLGQLHKSSMASPDFLKRSADAGDSYSSFADSIQNSAAPKLEIQRTPYGFREAAIRELADGRRHVNLRVFVAPSIVIVPTGDKMNRIMVITVPLDDVSTAYYTIFFKPERPLRHEDLERVWRHTAPDPDDIRGDIGDVDNVWRQDRAAMKAGHASGFPHYNLLHEDVICVESMGALADRTNEHLGRSDATIAYVRQQLLIAAARIREGGKAWGLEQSDAVDYGRIRSTSRILPAHADWQELDPYMDWLTDQTRPA